MHKDRSFEFSQRWRKLLNRTKDLDWEKTFFAKELRAEFDAGAPGDKALTKWCEVELDMPQYVAAELILRTVMATYVDNKGYEQVGGFSAVRQIAALDKRQQVHVIQSAKAQNKSVRSVMRDQGLLPDRPRVSENPDAALLAEFLIKSGVPIPPRIAKVVYRYVKKQVRHLKAA
jgi:hypothetical protein